jgi:hypothetical protein
MFNKNKKDNKYTLKLHTKYMSMQALCFVLAIPLCSMSQNSHAGLYGPTAHSRANCYNNESITWDKSNSYWWRVISIHYPHKSNHSYHHTEDTQMVYTWRAAAVHWGESPPYGDYRVAGFHYYYPFGVETLDVNTSADNCNIYDGWWD